MPIKLTKSDEELMLHMYRATNGNAHESHKRLHNEPYFSQGQYFSRTTILNCWRKNDLQIRSRGGANTLGKHWTCKRHDLYELAKICGVV